MPCPGFCAGEEAVPRSSWQLAAARAEAETPGAIGGETSARAVREAADGLLGTGFDGGGGGGGEEDGMARWITADRQASSGQSEHLDQVRGLWIF